MLFSKKGTTIIESIIVMVILVVGIVGMYNIFVASQKLSDSTGYRLSAIAMAREGIETVNNIRDTNWMLFSANTHNCWFTTNYNNTCITDPNRYFSSGSSYTLYQSGNQRWMLSGATTGTYTNSSYRDRFRVNKNHGLYTQSGGTQFLPLFTREIKIIYPSDAGSPPQKVNIESIVRWSDGSKASSFHEVKLQTTLTNWKKD